MRDFRLYLGIDDGLPADPAPLPVDEEYKYAFKPLPQRIRDALALNRSKNP